MNNQSHSPTDDNHIEIKTQDKKANIDFYQLQNSKEVDLDVEGLIQQTQNGHDTGGRHPLMDTPEEKKLWQTIGTVSSGMWFLFFLALSFLVFNSYDVYQTIYNAAQISTAWASIMGFSIAGVIGLFLFAIVSETKGFLSLKSLENPVTLKQLTELKDKEALIKTLQQKAQQQQKSKIAHQLNQAFFNSIQQHHSAKEIIQIYLNSVERPLHQRAKEIIKHEAARAGGGTFLSPNDLIRTLILVWINFRVITSVTQLYGLTPGYLGRLKLLKTVWKNVLLQNLTEIAAEQLLQDASSKILGGLLEKTSVATSTILLTSRIGQQLLKRLSLYQEKE